MTAWEGVSNKEIVWLSFSRCGRVWLKVAVAERLTQQVPRSHDRKWSWLVSSLSADWSTSWTSGSQRVTLRLIAYLTGSSALGVPPQPASDWSRDGQLVGGEVLRLLLQGVCGRRETQRVTPRQRAEEEKVTTATEISGRQRQLAENREKLWTGVESKFRLKSNKTNTEALCCLLQPPNVARKRPELVQRTITTKKCLSGVAGQHNNTTQSLLVINSHTSSRNKTRLWTAGTLWRHLPQKTENSWLLLKTSNKVLFDKEWYNLGLFIC